MGFYCGDRRIGDDGRKGTGFVTHHEVKGGLTSDGVRAVIVGELGMGDLFGPRGRVGATEDAEISFYFLVDMFSFSICWGW